MNTDEGALKPSGPDELRRLLWAWLEAARAYVSSKGAVSLEQRPYWVEIDENRQRREDRRTYNLLPKTAFELVELPEWHLFESALLADKAGSRLNKLLRTGRNGMTLRPVDIAGRFLRPLLSENGPGQAVVTQPDRELFNALFNDFLTFLTADSVASTECAYLVGATLPEVHAPLLLGPNLSLEIVSNDELLDLLQRGPFTNEEFFNRAYYAGRGRCLRLRYNFDLPIHVDTPTDQYIEPKEFVISQEHLDGVRSAFAILWHGSIGVVAKTSTFGNLFHFFGESLVYDPYRSLLSSAETLDLSGERLSAFVSNFAIAKRVAREDGGFDLPLRYLLDATQKTDLRERLIDIAIAAESMLIGGGTDELGYRFASRGALLLSNEVAERVALFETLRAAYNARSKIVHGTHVEPNAKFKVRAGHKMELGDLTREFEQHCREIFRRLAATVPLAKPTEEMWRRLELGGTLSTPPIEETVSFSATRD